MLEGRYFYIIRFCQKSYLFFSFISTLLMCFYRGADSCLFGLCVMYIHKVLLDFLQKIARFGAVPQGLRIFITKSRCSRLFRRRVTYDFSCGGIKNPH